MQKLDTVDVAVKVATLEASEAVEPVADLDLEWRAEAAALAETAFFVSQKTPMKTSNFIEECRRKRLTVASLTLGSIDTCKLDLTMTWARGRDVTLKLLKGSGPVTVVTNHVNETEGPCDAEFVPPAAYESSAEDTDGGTETEGDEMDDDEVEDIVKDAAEVGKPSGKK